MNTLYQKIDRCRNCVRSRADEQETLWCDHDYIGSPYNVSGINADYDLIPDWCPEVTARLEELYKQIFSGAQYFRIMDFIDRQKAWAPVEAIWHGKEHAKHVVRLGEYFLNELRSDVVWEYKITEKDIWLFKIAALLHNIGVFRVSANHAAKSAEMASDFLGDRTLISQDDADIITHAIGQHSDGDELNAVVDATLFLADKLDVAADRIRPDRAKSGELTPMQQEMQKIVTASLAMTKKFDSAYGHLSNVAELRYQTIGTFNPKALSEWPKCITGPRKVALEYLKCSDFKFIVNGHQIDYEPIIN